MELKALQIAVAGTLLVAAGGKLVAPGELAAALRAGKVFPKSVAGVVATLVVAAEIVLATAVLALGGPALGGAFAGAAALATAFALWGTSVRVRGIKLRCGCFGGASKDVTWGTVVRATILGAAAVAGIVAASDGAALLPSDAWGAASAAGSSACLLLLTAFIRTRSKLLLSQGSLQSLQSLSNQVRT
jgi:Methylamine utilisation protein MauE